MMIPIYELCGFSVHELQALIKIFEINQEKGLEMCEVDTHRTLEFLIKVYTMLENEDNRREFHQQQYENIVNSEAERQYHKGILDVLTKSPLEFIELEGPVVEYARKRNKNMERNNIKCLNQEKVLKI